MCADLYEVYSVPYMLLFGFAAVAGLDDDERRVVVHRYDAASADPVSDGAGRAAVGADARGTAAGAHARHQGAQVAGPGAAGPLPHGT